MNKKLVVDGVYTGPPIDAYGYFSTEPRHRKCRCTVPCAKRFQCRSKHHRGSRSVPWCVGAADRYPEFCDSCANKAEEEKSHA